MNKAVILIISDDPNLRESLADTLNVKGYKPLTAKDGAAGLSLLHIHPVDLMLFDLGSLDTSGLDVLSWIKVDHQSPSAIILTGSATLESAVEATTRGAFSYLVKPYETHQLLLQVRRALEKQQADTALRESEAKFRELLESAPGAMLLVNDRQDILMVNKQFEVLFNYDRSEVIGRQIEILTPPRFTQHQLYFKEYFQKPEIRIIGKKREFYALHKDGSEFPVEINLSPLKVPGGLIVSAVVRDLTKRRHYEAQLKHQANHDGLTGLPNRNLLIDRLGQALLYAKRHQHKIAVLFVDLDHFKFVNDSLGHDMGDRLLKIVAERLTACVRSNDTVARQGGDDFVIVLSDLMENEDAAKVAQKILAALNQPLTIDIHDLEVSCSIGISIYPKDGEDVQALLKFADASMYRAKDQGRNTFQFFTDEMNDKVVARTIMERSLRRALENNELSAHYQPQVELRTGRMVGMEALLRWNNPDLGMVSPANFIPLAEETGLIIPIGEWILRTACMQNKKWQRAGFPPVTMSVNLSPRQFWYPGLLETVAQALKDSGLEPCHLELEIVESMVMRDVESATAMLHKFKELGVRLAMDDFGTGYSSLSQLKRFPFDKLKMDISFVREVTSDPGSAAIARTIIAMAHNLNLLVIAEGVETEAQLCYLRTHGCDEIQGYFFSRPLSSRDFELLLQEGRHLQLPAEESPHLQRTLLLVDDEPYVISGIKRVLRHDGYRILSANSAQEGFELLATNQAGVVLCDQRMPGMDGTEFLSRVKSLYPKTVRIAMSGYTDMDMITAAINRGAIYKFLNKPIKNELLRQSIAHAFNRYEAGSAEKTSLPILT